MNRKDQYTLANPATSAVVDSLGRLVVSNYDPFNFMPLIKKTRKGTPRKGERVIADGTPMHEHMSTCSQKRNIESLVDGELEECMASSSVKRRLSYTQIYWTRGGDQPWGVFPVSILVLSWNVWELGNPRTFHDLKNILQIKRPTLIFLFGTHITGTQMGQLKSRLGLGGVFCVCRTGLLGGVSVMETRFTNHAHIFIS